MRSARCPRKLPLKGKWQHAVTAHNLGPFPLELAVLSSGRRLVRVEEQGCRALVVQEASQKRPYALQRHRSQRQPCPRPDQRRAARQLNFEIVVMQAKLLPSLDSRDCSEREQQASGKIGEHAFGQTDGERSCYTI